MLTSTILISFMKYSAHYKKRLHLECQRQILGADAHLVINHTAKLGSVPGKYSDFVLASKFHLARGS